MHVLSLFAVLTLGGTFTWAFDPRSYSKQVATCPGVLRTSEGNTVVDLHLRKFAFSREKRNNADQRVHCRIR